MNKKPTPPTPYEMTADAFAKNDVAGLLLRASSYQYRNTDLFGVSAPDLFTIYQDGLVHYGKHSSRKEVCAKVEEAASSLCQTMEGREAVRLVAYCEEFNRQNDMADFTLGLDIDKLNKLCNEAEANSMEPAEPLTLISFGDSQLAFPGF